MLIDDNLSAIGVSIHAPREGCDRRRPCRLQGCSPFQFTHPVRGATRAAVQEQLEEQVSIHAPREGCDIN